jgi:sortase B
MGKIIRRVIMIIAAAVFIVSAAYIAMAQYQYRESEKLYSEASSKYMSVNTGADASGKNGEGDSMENSDDAADSEQPPISIDFEKLQNEYPNVAGWLYCEDSVINYPIMKGSDNDYYLHHSYDGSYSSSGALFIDAENLDDFQDYNTIIYGHHMKNGSMFASLSKWAEQDYYDSHKVMWLLTPNQNYKIILFSEYTTSAYSDTYRIFREPGEEFSDYLVKSAQYSNFSMPETEIYADSHYVLLSTCAYVFDNARYVVHGMLVPVE